MPHMERYRIANELLDKGFGMGEGINTTVYTIDQWNAAPPSLFKKKKRKRGGDKTMSLSNEEMLKVLHT